MFSYFSYTQLKNFFLSKEALPTDKFQISVSSELLYVSEQYKKNKVAVNTDNFYSKYQELCKLSNEGLINFIELDSQILIDNLFEEDDEGILKIDSHASRSTISPRFSMNLLCLKESGCGCYWEENVFNEMVEYFKALEK